jgi:hypothetical protein
MINGFYQLAAWFTTDPRRLVATLFVLSLVLMLAVSAVPSSPVLAIRASGGSS